MKRFLPVLVLVAVCAVVAFGQEARRYEGYSFQLDADEGPQCAIKFLPNRPEVNSVLVYIAGTNKQTPATGLTSCDESTVQGNRVGVNGLQKWCFQGPEEMYEVAFSTGDSFLWYPLGRDTGFFNLLDFRPVKRTAAGKYEFSTPVDYSKTFRNAMAMLASRQGGTLRVPDGDYIVGTTDGNARDPNFRGITIPAGTTIEGASGVFSTPNANFPNRRSPTRIRLRNDKQAIFKIGNCANYITLRNLELVGNANTFLEGTRSTTATYGVEAAGKWAKSGAGGEAPNSAQFFSFENVTFQYFDIGLYVHNVDPDEKCRPNEQVCNAWQFDYVKVDHSVFLNNRTGIYIDTFNTDWKISNSQFSFVEAFAPGIGIRAKRVGTMLIEQSFGGGYNYTTEVGGTFIYIDTILAMTIVNSSAERTKRDIYTVPQGSVSSVMINSIGSVWNDRIELNGRLNFISTGNFYGARGIAASKDVTVTSTGDRFCYDPLVLPGQCGDARGNPVAEHRFGDARVMFRTGRLPEGTGRDRLERQPNYFGYDVEINNGILQLDPNITFRDITAFAAGGEGKPRVSDGAIVYCKDCRRGPVCTQGTAGTDGAFAKRINGQWRCD
jgi:hypothetical protein